MASREEQRAFMAELDARALEEAARVIRRRWRGRSGEWPTSLTGVVRGLCAEAAAIRRGDPDD